MSDPTSYFKSELLRLQKRVFCRCPEPDPPGWVHRMPVDCSPLLEGESLAQWRIRRFGFPDGWINRVALASLELMR